MNEPHDLDIVLWTTSVQEAVTAIRKAGATTQMILLPGTDFTSAQTFIENGSAGNLSTVTNLDGSTTNLIFDVHKYLDEDGSGTHTECVSNHIEDTFVPLAAFLVENKRMAILSEIGGGNSASVRPNLILYLRSQAFTNMILSNSA
jgi:endoglucanase